MSSNTSPDPHGSRVYLKSLTARKNKHSLKISKNQSSQTSNIAFNAATGRFLSLCSEGTGTDLRREEPHVLETSFSEKKPPLR